MPYPKFLRIHKNSHMTSNFLLFYYTYILMLFRLLASILVGISLRAEE